MTADPLYGIPPTATPTPSADVMRWRRRRLADAGFDEELAGVLAAEGDVDLHALLDLVDRGCPPHLTARIMGSRAAGIGAGSHG
ncbi:MAG: hypothetical protein ACRDP1_05080 [Nocardioidaceae bacterium]